MFGLGWTRPDIGLARWREMEYPHKEPILDLVLQWWGPERVEDYLAWAAVSRPFGAVQHELAERLYREPDVRELRDDPAFERRRATREWQGIWGGGWDPLHLTGHLLAPMTYPENHNPKYVDERSVDPADVSRKPRFLIIGDTYAGFYQDFVHYQLGKGANGRSIYTDYVVKPIGRLGTFRQHSATRLWFRGRSHIHLLGH